MAQARLLAIQTAGETPGRYGGQYQDVPMVFEAVEAIEEEDYYVVTLSFRPQGDFSGTPGQEQFFVEKEGTIAVRQVLRLPRQRGGFPLFPVAIGLVVVGVIAALGAVFALGGSGDDGATAAVVIPTETKTPTPAEAATPTLEPTLHTTDTPTPTPRPILTVSPFRPTRRPILTPTPRPILTPTRRPTATPNASSYYNKGEDYFADEKYQLAINEFTTAIRLNPSYTNAYGNRGNAYYKLGQHQRAIQDYDKVIQLDPDEALAYYNRGNSYGHLGQDQRAKEDFDKVIQLDPDYAKAYVGRGVAYYNLGQYSQQRNDEAKACSLDSKYC